MKAALFAVALIALLGASRGTEAQSAVKLTMEDTHTIKEVVLKDPKIAHAKSGSFAVGDTAPADVALQPFPAEVTDRIGGLKGYSFFVAGEQIVVVNTSDKRIAEVIK